MKKNKSLLWGIILIVVGVILAGNALNLFNISIFFKGWWTLFIIVPSLFGLFYDNNKTSSLIFLVIGVLLLLSCLEVINFDLVWSLIVPIIIVGFGLSLVFRNSFNKEDKNIKKGDGEVFATFSGQKVNVTDEFKGTSVNAIFGGVELDLRDAKIKNDVVIDVCSVFGGVDIRVNDDVEIKVKSTSIFGGVDNKVKSDKAKKHTIYVNATCIFGGVDIK